MSNWSDWTICNKECGNQSRERRRNVITPETKGGSCEGIKQHEIESCNLKPCPSKWMLILNQRSCLKQKLGIKLLLHIFKSKIKLYGDYSNISYL